MKVIKKIVISFCLLSSIASQSNAWFGFGNKEPKEENLEQRIENNENIQKISRLIKNAFTNAFGQISQNLQSEYQNVLLKTINLVFDQLQNQTEQICRQTENQRKIEFLVTTQILQTLNELAGIYKGQITDSDYLVYWLTNCLTNKFQEFYSNQEGQGGNSIIDFEKIKSQISEIVSTNCAKLIAQTGEIIESDDQDDISMQVTEKMINTLSEISNQIGIILAELAKNITEQFVAKQLEAHYGGGWLTGFAAGKVESTILSYIETGTNKLAEDETKEIIRQTIEPHLLSIVGKLDKKRKTGNDGQPGTGKKRKTE